MKTFNETVKDIEKAEKKVDKVLKAARLQRHHKESNVDWEFIFGLSCMMFVFALYALIIITG